jgi:hypothetical protein
LWAFDRVFLAIGSARGSSSALFDADQRITAGKESVLPPDFDERWSSRPPSTAASPALELRAGE